MVTKLATNSADFGSAGLASLLQAKAQGEVPVVAVAPIYNKQPDAFFTTEGSGIEASRTSSARRSPPRPFRLQRGLAAAAGRNGIDPASVKLLKLDPGALAPMLATGKVDATINWLTVAPGFVRALGEADKTLKTIPVGIRLRGLRPVAGGVAALRAEPSRGRQEVRQGLPAGRRTPSPTRLQRRGAEKRLPKSTSSRPKSNSSPRCR